VTSTPRTSTRLRVDVMRGGRPDEATLAAIEQAVRTVLSRTQHRGAEQMPAWRHAARLEGTTSVRIGTRVQAQASRRR
jgi:hypothetical protein